MIESAQMKTTTANNTLRYIWYFVLAVTVIAAGIAESAE